MDSDGDGWSDVSEDYLGLDEFDACGGSSWAPDISPGPGFPGSTTIDILDLTLYITPIRYLDTDIGDNPPNDIRYDINPGPGFPGSTDIDVLDITFFVTGKKPPMLQGITRMLDANCPFP